MRIIQPGHGARRSVLVGYYCQAAIDQMARALPDALVLSVDNLAEPRQRRADLLQRAKVAGADELGEVCLVGWSAGCHRVRDALDSIAPEIVIALDGEHVSLTGHNMPIEPWRELTAKARRGEVLFIASHIYQTYVEHLKVTPGQPTPAFESTVRVLRELTGWDLPEPTDPLIPAVRRDGDLIVYSWASADIDGPAHVRQINHAGPLLVRDWVCPRWNGGGAPDTSAETLAGLATSTAEALAATEPPPETRRKGDAPAGQGGALPHGYRCSVAELCADARALGTLHPIGDGYDPKVGDLICSGRSGENPLRGGRGHVERIESIARTGPAPSFAGAVLRTIGGNESNTWVLAPFAWPGEAVAVIAVPAESGYRSLEVARAELAAHVAEVAGPKANPRIQTYHAGARRDGSSVAGMPGHEAEGSAVLGPHASDEVAWCASGASWCAYQASAILRSRGDAER